MALTNRMEMTDKTEIKIEGDSIIYNGVKYQKVQEEPKKNTPNLTDVIFETLENILASYEDYSEVYDNAYHISEVLVDVMSEHIPDYSDWEGAWDELPEESRPQNGSVFFRYGWNAYCKKMWDMINDD